MFTYTSFWHCCACLPPFLLICLRHLDSFLGNIFPLSLSCRCLDDLLALFFFFDNYRENILLFLCSLTSFETGFHNSVQIARNNLLETWHHSMCNLLIKKDSTNKPKNKKKGHSIKLISCRHKSSHSKTFFILTTFCEWMLECNSFCSAVFYLEMNWS